MHEFLDQDQNRETEFLVGNSAGLQCRFTNTGAGWALGPITLHGRPVETAGVGGLLFLRETETGTEIWLRAANAQRVNERTARFAGQATVDGTVLAFQVEFALHESLPAVQIAPSWTVDRDLIGWEIGFAYHEGFSHEWRAQSYPWAGNSAAVEITPMRYCGVPGVLMYRRDLSLVSLFALNSNSDYLNPTSWTGETSFHFADQQVAPSFRVAPGVWAAGTRYEWPLQLIFSDAGNFVGAAREIVTAWIDLTGFQVDASLQVREPQEAFDLALQGRRHMSSWKPGIGYEHHKGTPFVYVGNSPYIAYFEYRLHELTRDALWRQRAFEQIDFALQGQQPSGVFHTSWYFEHVPRPGGVTAQGFCSWDWMHDGYKVDINVWMARYILHTWERVKTVEGVDRRDWYDAAIASLHWVLEQRNPDGGLPQCVNIATGEHSCSVVSGRALVALPKIAEITGDDRYLQAAAGLETFLRDGVEGRFWYTGMHPDLPPEDYEQDSLFAVVEYWLDQHDASGKAETLEHALANAYLALLYWCPKQLSWVTSLTQCAHSEQQNFNQYSVYCYGNRKIQCLDRLHRKTGISLFQQLTKRVMQLNFYVQVAQGPYRGAMTEAIADPWLERNNGFEWRGNPYTSELVTDLMLQLMEMGLVATA